MPEYTEKGLSLRWDTPDLVGCGAEGTQARVVVAARPRHPSNVVTAVYTVDGGAPRVARGHRLPSSRHPGGEERFAVDLPLEARKSVLAYVPILSCSGREADPRRGGHPLARAPASARAAASQIAGPRQGTRPPFDHSMELLTRLTAPLAQPPVVIGETDEGLRIAFQLAKGAAVRGPRLNGSVLHSGGDWMLIRRDGIGISQARIVIEADDELVMGEYGGVVDFGPNGYQLMATGRGPAEAAVQMAPRFVTCAPSLTWINRVQCIALGRVTLATLLVEYDIYAMRSLAARTT